MECTRKIFLDYRTHFDAAHFLRGYKGKCANLHGHRWEVVVTISGTLFAADGILMDFSDLKRIMNDIVPDHQCINTDVPEFEFKNPTAENLSIYIYNQISMALDVPDNPNQLSLEKVTVYESPNASATYKGE